MTEILNYAISDMLSKLIFETSLDKIVIKKILDQ